MDLVITTSIIAPAFAVVFALVLWRGMRRLRNHLPEPQMITQDDFHTSATRWGYLTDKRMEE
jgi:hypothetical protein